MTASERLVRVHHLSYKARVVKEGDGSFFNIICGGVASSKRYTRYTGPVPCSLGYASVTYTKSDLSSFSIDLPDMHLTFDEVKSIDKLAEALCNEVVEYLNEKGWVFEDLHQNVLGRDFL